MAEVERIQDDVGVSIRCRSSSAYCIGLGALTADATCELHVLQTRASEPSSDSRVSDGKMICNAMSCQCARELTLGMMVTRLAWMAHRFVSVAENETERSG